MDNTAEFFVLFRWLKTCNISSQKRIKSVVRIAKFRKFQLNPNLGVEGGVILARTVGFLVITQKR